MQATDCRLQIGFKMQTRYKMQSADSRLGLKCRVRPKLWHSLKIVQKIWVPLTVA